MNKQKSELNSKISGRFQSGVSGNPKGRPPGIEDTRTALRKLLYPHAEALVQKAVELALSGDAQALRLCIERLIPRAKNETVDLPIDDMSITKAGDLPLLVERILMAVKDQQITAEQAKTLCDVIETQRRLIETCELEARLTSIEQTLNHRGFKHAKPKS